MNRLHDELAMVAVVRGCVMPSAVLSRPASEPEFRQADVSSPKWCEECPLAREQQLSCENFLTSSSMQFINTLTVLALVVASFALIVAVPVLYASSEDSGRSNRLTLLGSTVWLQR